MNRYIQLLLKCHPCADLPSEVSMSIKDLLQWNPVTKIPDMDMNPRLPILYRTPNKTLILEWEHVLCLTRRDDVYYYKFIPDNFFFHHFKNSTNIHDAILIKQLRDLRFSDRIPDITTGNYVALYNNDSVIKRNIDELLSDLSIGQDGRTYLFKQY